MTIARSGCAAIRIAAGTARADELDGCVGWRETSDRLKWSDALKLLLAQTRLLADKLIVIRFKGHGAMQDTPSLDAIPKGIRFYFGVAILLFGYTTALLGSIAFFKIPLSLTCALMLGGIFATFLPVLFDRRLAFVLSSRTYIATNLIGSMLIVAIMIACANSNWKNWYIHPAGFQSTWLFLVAAFFHCRGILNQFPSTSVTAEISKTDYDESQKNNPYSPPMQSESRANYPTA